MYIMKSIYNKPREAVVFTDFGKAFCEVRASLLTLAYDCNSDTLTNLKCNVVVARCSCNISILHEKLLLFCVVLKSSIHMLRLIFNFFFLAGALDEALDYIHDLEARLQKTDLPPPALFSRYCSSDDQIRFYTKFSSERVFTVFWESIAPSAHRLVYWTKAQRAGEEGCEDPSPPRSMPLIDEFLMYSMRVAVGMKEQVIADMFNVSIARVSRVTITWANYLYMMLGSLPIWISREKVKSTMPLKFQRYYPNTRVILDCTEIALETASSLTLQSETFSSYKNRTTLKGLIGVAPNGLVTFVSPLYTGCISDKEITKISGVLPLLEPGDEVMADKGFLIQDLLAGVGCSTF